jgi:hypothetical protein
MALAALLVLAACAPRTETPEPPTTPPATTPAPERPTAPSEAPPADTLTLTDPAALEADRTAREAFHLMGLNYLETGRYSAEILLNELDLPTGVLWTIQEVSETSYRLQITSDSVPGVVWAVTPEGVRARQVEDNQIY